MVPTAALLTALLSVGAQPLTGFIDVVSYLPLSPQLSPSA